MLEDLPILEVPKCNYQMYCIVSNLIICTYCDNPLGNYRSGGCSIKRINHRIIIYYTVPNL